MTEFLCYYCLCGFGVFRCNFWESWVKDGLVSYYFRHHKDRQRSPNKDYRRRIDTWTHRTNGSPAGEAGQNLQEGALRGLVALGVLLGRGKRLPKSGLDYAIILVEALFVPKNRNQLPWHNFGGRCGGSSWNPQSASPGEGLKPGSGTIRDLPVVPLPSLQLSILSWAAMCASGLSQLT